MEQKKYKPTIFVASSRESKPIADAIKLYFDHDYEVDLWTDNIFKLNEGTLDTLLNRSGYYDFFIAVFSADDTAKIREQEKNVTRDNVIFEFGLFLGRIGIDRTFFVLEEGVELFSDWNGITPTIFQRRDNLASAIGASCIRIKEKMDLAERLFEYTILPSTALALGYYHNFLRPVFDAFQNQETIEILEKTNGQETRLLVKITDHYPTIEIHVPSDLKDLEKSTLNEKTRDYKQLLLRTHSRIFPFYIQGQFDEHGALTFFDIPTTLLSSELFINKFFSERFLENENMKKKLMDKEIRNFEKTLSKLIPDSLERKYYKFIRY